VAVVVEHVAGVVAIRAYPPVQLVGANGVEAAHVPTFEPVHFVGTPPAAT
jgi:hypothetical protein